LILRKIIKIVATRCHILQLKGTIFNLGWGSAQTPLGERFRPPRWIYGAYFYRGGEGSRGSDGFRGR